VLQALQRHEYATRVEQPQVELIVRLTARISAAAFAAALMVFAARGRSRPVGVRHEIRLLIAFVLAHTIHFGAVMCLAVVTAGENIRARGGWILVLTVAVLFYLAAFSILRAWRLADAAAWPRGQRLVAHAGVVFIALIFLNSYGARAVRMPVYWLPAILMAAAVVAYFIRVRPATFAIRSATGSPSG
jgi:hypothetical protein